MPVSLAIPRLQRGDRAAGIAGDLAQFVERGVVPLGDEAADWRARSAARAPARATAGRSARRARQGCGSSVVEQGRAVGLACQRSRACGALRPGRRAIWPRSRGLPRPATIRPSARPISGRPRSDVAQIARAAAGRRGSNCDQRQPRLDRVHGRSAARKGLRPAAARPRRSRSGRPRRSGCRCVRPAGLRGFRGWRASPRPSPCRRRSGAQHGRQQQRQRAAPGMVEIGDQPARRRQHRAARSRRTRRAWRRRAPPCSRASPASLAKSLRGRDDRIRRARRPSPPARPLRSRRVRASAAREHAPARIPPVPSRPVEMSQAATPQRPAHVAYGGQHVGAARFEQRFLGQRAGGDEAHDVARHQRLRGRLPSRLPAFASSGRFDLFGDRHAAARLDQPGEIAFRRMDRHAAHRHRLAVVLAAAWSARCRARPRRPSHRRRTVRRSRPCGRTAGNPPASP